MNRNARISRGTVTLLAVACALSAGAWMAYYRLRATRPAPSPELTQLLAEAAALAANTDLERSTWQERRKSLPVAKWDQRELARLADRFADWRWEWTAPDRATLFRDKALFTEWPRCVADLDDLGRKPGVTIQSVVINAIGTPRERRFPEFRVGLRFQMADTSPSSVPNPSGSRAGYTNPMATNKPISQ